MLYERGTLNNEVINEVINEDINEVINEVIKWWGNIRVVVQADHVRTDVDSTLYLKVCSLRQIGKFIRARITVCSGLCPVSLRCKTHTVKRTL